MSKVRFMIDIEGLGPMPGGVILSIGWCRFSPDWVSQDESGEVRLEIQSQLDAGLSVDGSTLDWWLHQTALPWAPGTVAQSPKAALVTFLASIAKADEIWAKPPQYDLAGIRAACTTFGIQDPWHFRKERCFRTIKAMAPAELHLEPLAEGTKHGALVDAVHQAREAGIILESMIGRRSE